MTGTAVQEKVAQDGLDDDWSWPGSFFTRLYTTDQAEQHLETGPPPNAAPPRRAMENAAALRKQAEAMLARAELIERHGQLALDLEKMVNGAVVAFTKRWGHRGPGYLYAAIKAEGTWNTTGPKSPKVYTSAQFADWLRGAKAGSGRAVDDLVILVNRIPVASGYSTVHDAEEGPSGLYDNGEFIPASWATMRTDPQTDCQKAGCNWFDGHKCRKIGIPDNHSGMGGWEGEGG